MSCNWLLAEEVVDPVDLFLSEDPVDLVVEPIAEASPVAERLLITPRRRR
jgi:hypothetical protein